MLNLEDMRARRRGGSPIQALVGAARNETILPMSSGHPRSRAVEPAELVDLQLDLGLQEQPHFEREDRMKQLASARCGGANAKMAPVSLEYPASALTRAWTSASVGLGIVSTTERLPLRSCEYVASGG